MAIVLDRFIGGPDDDSEGVETCRPEVVDYNKTVMFDCHLYVLYCHMS
jgi:hypothetical protein